MFTKNRVLGVNGSTLSLTGRPDSAPVGAYHARPQKQELNASLGAGIGGGGFKGSLAVNGFWQSNYQYYMTGLIPADPNLIDTSTLALFYRDIYLFDNTAGSAVDIQSHFPFSDWELRGLDAKDLKPFEDALAQLNLQTMMPLISTAHLVDGFFCGSLVFDAQKKRFIDTLIHDALACSVIPAPFFNIDPTINVRVSQATQQFLHDTSVYARQYLRQMPRQFLEMLRAGAFTLDELTTLFIPRRSTTDRAYTSYLHRVLPMYLIEKVLFRGTLVEAQRRQRAMTHLTAGDDRWTPNTEELNQLVRAFMTAEEDPMGGWVSTRNAVQAVDIRPGGDFWKWTDMADVLVPYKLRALGISEAFLSGDTSYASAESAYSTFLETQNSYRTDLTARIFYSKLFPLIAVVNGLYKDPSKGTARSNELMTFLFDKSNRANLKMPELHWHKELEAKGEDDMLELLEMASSKGVPIPLKMWMAAAKIAPESLLRDLEEDNELRQKLAKYTGKDTTHEGEDEYSDMDDHQFGKRDSGERGDFDSGDEYENLKSRTGAANVLTTQTLGSMIRSQRKPLLARDFGDSGDTWKLTKTGKIKHIPSAAQPEVRARANDQIIKIARTANRDPNYRENLKRRNIEKLGRATLPE